MTFKTFSANGRLDSVVPVERDREITVSIGQVDGTGADVANNFGGGTVLICKTSSDGSSNLTPIKSVTSITDKDDKSSRFILPLGTDVDIILMGSTSPNLYVEVNQAPRRNP